MSSEIIVSDNPINADTSSYSKWPIDPKLEIRILELLPPASPDPAELHCNLITAKLSNKPPYEAISYAWGDPVFDDKLYLPAGWLAITSNLGSALRRVRHPDRPRRLWVDAVCINQLDDTEKGHQVMLMAQIYRSTTRVLAWLGEGNKETDAAIRTLKDLTTKAWRFGIDISKPPDAGLMPGEGEGVKRALKDTAEQVDWDSLLAFFRQSWFSRLWIVQEVALPPVGTLINGQNSIGFTDLEHLFAFFIGMFEVMGDLDSIIRVGTAMSVFQERTFFLRYAKSNPYEKWLGIRIIIDSHCERSCCNSMDKIYGLLGLQHDSDPISVDVKYGISVEELYQTFTFQYLKIDDIYILHHAGEGLANSKWNTERRESQDGNKSHVMTTWAVDWRRSKYIILDRIGGRFKAATKLSPSVVAEEKSLPFIGLAGVRIGRVDRETTTIFPTPDPSRWLKHILTVSPDQLIRTKQEFAESMIYPTGEDVALAFVETLVMGNRRFSNISSLLGNSMSPQEIYLHWREFEEAVEREDRVDGTASSEASDTRYAHAAADTCSGHSFIVTESGYFGLGPLYTKPGDVVVIFDGDNTPFVLRQIKVSTDTESLAAENADKGFWPEDQYELVGECYIQGLMDNEVVAPKWRAKKETFWIR